MTAVRTSFAGIVLALAFPSQVIADPPATIPIKIRWNSIQPDSIALVVEGGTDTLNYNTQDKVFHGRVMAPTLLTSKQTILVRYGPNSYPLVVNVRRSMPNIEFTVAIDPYPSCATLYIDRIDTMSDNMDDAMRMMLSAARMLKIPRNNNCSGDRKKRVVRAQFARNQNLATKSNGLFGIDPSAETAFLQLPSGATQYASALATANLYQADADAANAGSIYRDVKMLIALEKPKEALALTEAISNAVRSDTETAKSFADQGVTKERLLKDIDFISTLAAQQAAPDK